MEEKIAENIPFIFPYPAVCPECNRQWGRTRLAYQGIEIWVSCGCLDDDKMYLINTDNFKDLTPRMEE